MGLNKTKTLKNQEKPARQHNQNHSKSVCYVHPPGDWWLANTGITRAGIRAGGSQKRPATTSLLIRLVCWYLDRCGVELVELKFAI